MNDFIRYSFDKVINVEKLITIFYMECSKDFCYDGERHDFWEIVYIDKGEMICTADKRNSHPPISASGTAPQGAAYFYILLYFMLILLINYMAS